MSVIIHDRASDGERLYGNYLRATPLLWMFGILTPAGARCSCSASSGCAGREGARSTWWSGPGAQ